MQTDPAERRRRRGRGRRAEPTVRSPEEEPPRLAEVIMKPEEDGGRAGEVDEGEGGRGRGRKAASEGGDEERGRLRWRLNQLEKEKLELTSSHNRELCTLQAELTRLRSSVERGEAQRVELQYQLTVSRRDADRAAELSRDKRTLTERAAELQQTVRELQKALQITQQARQEDQHALQQEVEERDKLIESFSSESQRLHRLLQDQEEALQESERRMAELQKEREKEAEASRRQADELRYLTEREERSRREKEVADRRVRTLESSVEAERAAHLESKFNCEIIQLRARDLEAALAAERSGQQEAQRGLELLREVERAHGLERERRDGTERALQRLQTEYEQCKAELSVAVETERKATSDLSERLEEEKERHAHTHTLLEQAEQVHVNFVQKISEMLQQPNTVHDGSPAADVLQLLQAALGRWRRRTEEAETRLRDLLLASEALQEENRALGRRSSDRSRRLQESRQAEARLEEELSRLQQETSDLRVELQREREERERERERDREEREREREEKEREREEKEREREREREEKTTEVQKITENFHNESKAHLSVLHCVYQRLLSGGVVLAEPQCMLGDFTREELSDVIGEQAARLTSDLRDANDKIAQLQSVCDRRSVCVRELQRRHERVWSRLEEGVRRREGAWSRRHAQLQSRLQACRSQCDSLRDRCSSLTSDLCRSRGEAASLLPACALLGGALRHAGRRLRALGEQKRLLSRRLAEREALEEEVRRLADALGGEEEEEEQRGRRAAGRWRRSVWAVVAARRWHALAKETTVLLRLERGGGAVCGEAEPNGSGCRHDDGGDDEGRERACARWLRSKRLSSAVVSCVADLQAALTHTGSSPADVMSAARSGLSRLLDLLLDQSDAPGVRPRPTPTPPHPKALVSALRKHFLLFSQRLHSAEVERRSLRLELAEVRRGRRREGEDAARNRMRSSPPVTPASPLGR